MYDFWKIMQWFLRMRENLYDYDAEQRVYGLKTLYTMKLNKLLREKKNINSLIGTSGEENLRAFYPNRIIQILADLDLKLTLSML